MDVKLKFPDTPTTPTLHFPDASWIFIIPTASYMVRMESTGNRS